MANVSVNGLSDEQTNGLRGRDRLAAALGVILGSIVLLGALASPASALPQDFFGVTWNGDLLQSEDDWDAMQKSGAAVYRVGIHWGWVTQNSGDEFHWAPWDAIFRLAAERDMTVFPNLVGDLKSTPRFPAKSEYEGWKDFVYESVRRYGYEGDFWEANPNLAYKPVTMWEVWPEANIAGANPIASKKECEEIEQPYVSMAETCVQPHAYGELLKISAEAIEEAHLAYAPSSPLPEVIFSGLAPHELLYPESEELGFGSFLEESAEVPGVTASFDSYGIHPYAFYGNQIENLKDDILIAREQLDGLGLFGKSISVTEMGWPVKEEDLRPGEPGFTEVEQASLVEKGFDWIKDEAETLDIRSLMYYSNRDRPLSLGDTWDTFSGLRNQDAENRPSWTVFREATGAAPWLPEVVTKRASEVGGQEATLNGIVNGHGFDTDYHFEYLSSEAYKANEKSFSGPHAPAETAEAAAGAQSKAVNQTLDGLEGGLYYYRLIAVNSEGETHGSIRSFRISGWRVDDTYDNTDGGANDNRLTDVSCPSEDFCIATAGLSYGWNYAYTQEFDGEGWSYLGVPENSRTRLSGISCAAADECVAVGDRTNEKGEILPLAYHFNGEKWTKGSTYDSGSGTDKRLTDVSCSSEGFCIATANLVYGWNYAYTQKFDGEGWSYLGVPENPRAYLSGISCATVGECIAVGHRSNESGTVHTPLAYRWDGKDWSKDEPLTKGSGGQLIGISCVSFLCGTVGHYTNGAGTWTLAEQHLEFRLDMLLAGEGSEVESEQPRIESNEFPLTIAGIGASTLSIRENKASIKCENADFEAQLIGATSILPFNVQDDDSCSVGVLPTLVRMNSCSYVLNVLNSGPPYVGNVDIDCDKAEDAIEYRVYANQGQVEAGEPFCMVRIPSQEGLKGVALENVSEGAVQGVALDIEANGVAWSQSGGCKAESHSDGVWTGSAVLAGVG